MIEFGHATHTGLLRAYNEDTYWADADLGLFIVADGIGGPGRGELGSAIACQAIVAAVQREQDLERALAAAARHVAARARTEPGEGPLGAMLAVLHVGADHYTAASVGDSHLFGWREGRLWRIDNATPAPAAPGARPQRSTQPVAATPPHRVTQALGITPADALHAVPSAGPLEPGMQFLLCSDGLLEDLKPTQIATLMARTELAAQECVEHLILMALDAGGRDNLTALLLRIV